MLLIFLAAEAATLSLTCRGSVTTQVVQGTDSAYAYDNAGNSVTANGVRTAPATLALTTGFEMSNGTARVYIPAEMRPAMSNTKDGWFPVQDLVVTDAKITGKVKLNFMRSTVIEIDRTTDVLTTKHGYRADCTAIDRSVRKF